VRRVVECEDGRRVWHKTTEDELLMEAGRL
jgi:hypothetical protein